MPEPNKPRGYCLSCKAWFPQQPWTRCPGCNEDTLLAHLPGETCMAMDCPMCCHLFVEEELP